MTMRLACYPVAAVLFGCISGCSLYSSPFRDEFAKQPPVSTPSIEAALAVPVTPAAQERRGEPKIVSAVDGAVWHYPLYFEDPADEHGSDDGAFKVTAEDYVWIAKWRARFLVNLIAFPVHAVLTPPWHPMVSDGRYDCCGRGRTYDAVPCCPSAAHR
jgi:hypothetical protein